MSKDLTTQIFLASLQTQGVAKTLDAFRHAVELFANPTKSDTSEEMKAYELLNTLDEIEVE